MLSCKVGEKIIYAIGSKNREILKKYSQKGILRCPICDGEMQFRAGKIKVWHFAHKTKCKCENEKFEDETKEHYDGKKLLYIWFKLQPNIEKVELEKWLPNIRLRPDLFVIDKKGKKYCIEYQCTPITQEQKDYKSELYELNDMIPVWIFGVERIGEKSKVASQYRLDSSNKLFYKRGFTQKIKKKNENFYFEDGEFYLNEEINFNFRNKLQSLKIQHRLEKEREKERRNKQYNELLKQQKLIYRKVLEEIHTDQKNKKLKRDMRE